MIHITVALLLLMTTVVNLLALYAADLTKNEGTTTLITTTSAATTPYRGYLFFEIHTADEQSAGTDSNIYVTIVGTKTNLTRKALRSIGPSMNAFERNQVDVCMLYTNVKFDQADNIIRGIELINDGRWAGSCKFSNSVNLLKLNSLIDIAWKPSCIYLSAVDGAQTNDRWVISGSSIFISLLEPNKAVCYA
jgi:hypothetical protein